MEHARLTRYGLLSVSGADARAFLHAQLTNDISNLPPGHAALAGWCSAKGRLLASFVVIPWREGFLLQLARDLVPGISRRLSMFVLRSKVKIVDESERWMQFGVWGEALPGDLFSMSETESAVRVKFSDARTLLISNEPPQGRAVDESRWTLDEIRAGRPLITAATQELFVPQMVNLHQLGGVDFKKGCYPGQEVVARTQYRGQLKRHMIHAQVPAAMGLKPGGDYEGGTVVDIAPAGAGSELLAVIPIPE
jgi:folate-binding protein YgfZ